jgi:hypothetical protein
MNPNDKKLLVFIVLFYLCSSVYMKLFFIYIGRANLSLHMPGRRDYFIDTFRVIRFNPCNSKSLFSLSLAPEI